MNSSFSFEGQDLIIQSILREVDAGFYIDVGCNHPVHNNNTHLLYQSGWSGLAVDGNSAFTSLWSELRPRDKFVTSLVSDEVKEVRFTVFEDSTMSTADCVTYERYVSRNNSVLSTCTEMTTTLTDLIYAHGVHDREINLLCVDVEGEDFNVIRGLDFDFVRPGVICLEIKNLSLYSLIDNAIVDFLAKNGYRLIAKTPLDSIFVFPGKQYLKWIPSGLL